MTVVDHVRSRFLQLGRHRAVSRVVRAAVPLDKAVTRISRGSVHLIPEALLPQLTLTTVGRRSGVARAVPLLYVRDGEDFVVIASNFGQKHHPAWSYNLEATPDAEVLLGTRRIPVRARRVSESDRKRLWPSIVAVWPAYDDYVDWAGERTIKLYRLTPR
ncbi:nitroreductase family deazaflavin-dependent oxidoreductase [Tsukamurella asaccharolytica]|uniref:Nitroreductase family deazaflavin-dependent oxidoreductase n=1 Tax=Tsukamurella asaccharolytica TaxID=2592067 RepID=A0A5C5R6L5_9ACTN|nr:nitroreductase/quinone reductase family protein [Tsukamurella asaccharolytica]TWS18590.1 nitroreductase family deazaflavin-dependent oxidoreductase [Tsukamurella asaccharolytica]